MENIKKGWYSKFHIDSGVDVVFLTKNPLQSSTQVKNVLRLGTWKEQKASIGTWRLLKGIWVCITKQIKWAKLELLTRHYLRTSIRTLRGLWTFKSIFCISIFTHIRSETIPNQWVGSWEGYLEVWFRGKMIFWENSEMWKFHHFLKSHIFLWLLLLWASKVCALALSWEKQSINMKKIGCCVH